MIKLFGRRTLGIEGENIALQFLKKKGYRLLEQNYRTRYGEIDIIVQDKDDIVFAEVKLRRSLKYGTPQESVTLSKQTHIVKAALQYMKAKGLAGSNMRFDVLTVGPEPGKIEHLRSAFTASGMQYY